MSRETEGNIPLYVAAEGWSGYGEDILDHWLSTGFSGSHDEKHLSAVLAKDFPDLAVKGCNRG